MAACLVLLSIVGCDWTPERVGEETLVVEAFLETGAQVQPIILRRTRPLRAGGPADSARASGADVALILDQQRTAYVERDPGWYEPQEETIRLPAGTPWTLSITWNGETAEARGRMPPPIKMKEVCVDVPAEPSRAVQVDSLRRDSLDIPTDQGYLYPIDVSIRWDSELPNPGSDPTNWVRAELRPDATSFQSEVVRFFLQPVDVRREDRYRRQAQDRLWRGVYAIPVEKPTDGVPAHALTATLVRGDSAFASFAQSRTDSDRREPISNVDGALGVALGVAIDSLRLDSLSTTGMENCVSPL